MHDLEKIYPDSPEAIIPFILEANRKKTGVIPCGKGYLVEKFICSGSQKAIFISTEKLDTVLDLDIDNLSVKVQAGLTLSRLQEELNRHNVFLPVTVESHGHRTMGGLVAGNEAGYEAYAYDTIQNHILGLEFITPYGTLVKTGGKTVKNVSGYDATRLLSRSWGTLGVITAITFRLKPVVESKITFIADLPSIAEAFQLAKEIKKTGLCLSTLKLFHTKQQVYPWRLIVNLTGFAETVNYHLETIKALAKGQQYQIIKNVSQYWQHYYRELMSRESETIKFKGPGATIWQMTDTLGKLAVLTNVQFCEIDLGIGEITMVANNKEELSALQQRILSVTGNMGLSYNWVKPPKDPLYHKLKAALDPNRIMFPCHKWLGGEHLG